MELILPANAFEWVENCPNIAHAKVAMSHVRLTTERIKIEPGTVVANMDNPPSWFYDWSQKPYFLSAANQNETGGIWYCATCQSVWVVYRGLWFKTSVAPPVPTGIVDSIKATAPVEQVSREVVS